MGSKFTKEDRDVLQMCIPRNVGVFLAEAAQHLLDDYDTVRASEARLREALGKIAEEPQIQHDPNDGLEWSICPLCCCSDDCGEAISHDQDCPIAIAQTALSASSGEWLERHDAEVRETERRLHRHIDEALLTSIETNATLLARAEKAEAERDGLAQELAQFRGVTHDA